MAPRLHIVLLCGALACAAALLPAGVASARPAQDGGAATFGGQGAQVTTTVADATTAAPTETTLPTDPTLVETPDQPARRLVTESRKVMAVIGGLVIVALALMLLTVRYIRQTKPVAPTAEPEPDVPASLPVLDDEPIFVDEPEPTPEPETAAVPSVEDPAPEPVIAPDAATTEPVVEAAAVPDATPAPDAPEAAPAADHTAADADYEPHSGEQERVEIPAAATSVRPSAAARRRALGLTDDA